MLEAPESLWVASLVRVHAAASTAKSKRGPVLSAKHAINEQDGFEGATCAAGFQATIAFCTDDR
jgi:hypothetical protein